MKKSVLSLLVLVLCMVQACKTKKTEVVVPDDEIQENTLTITNANIKLSVNENQPKKTILTQINAKSRTENPITFVLLNQNIDNAISIKKTTGEIMVNNPSAFDFETHKEIKAKCLVNDGNTNIITSISIRLKDVEDAFKTTWSFETNQALTIHALDGYSYNYTVDWGDGSPIQTGITGDATHTYKTTDYYTVAITGTFPTVRFEEAKNLIALNQWGDIAWKSLHKMFYNCENMIYKALDAPNLSDVKDISFLFKGVKSVNTNLNHWDVSKIENMESLFEGVKSNFAVESWNIGKVKTLKHTFAETEFNRDISQWNTSNVEDMEGTFKWARLFNQNIDSWNVNNVKVMKKMFYGARTFNQPLNSWNIENINDISWMFRYASAFNGNIKDWKVDNVRNMEGLFSFAESFNGDLGQWKVNNVRNMAYLFESAKSFEGKGITKWNTSKVKNMYAMFYGAIKFNKDIYRWDVRSVTSCQNFVAGIGITCAYIPRTIRMRCCSTLCE